jgi:hypothetical protein
MMVVMTVMAAVLHLIATLAEVRSFVKQPQRDFHACAIAPLAAVTPDSDPCSSSRTRR